MTTTARTITTGLAAAILGAALMTVAGPRTVEPCGTVTEDHVTAPAYCGDPAELHARLDALHAERSAGRFAEVGR